LESLSRTQGIETNDLALAVGGKVDAFSPVKLLRTYKKNANFKIITSPSH
jgi:hypothetical protein